MKFLARYVHGSGDSTDTDVVYVVDVLPDKAECKRFCSESPVENRNLITIKDGIVSEVYKGTADEVNNAIIATYSLHEQSYPLLITRAVERIVPLKYVRGIRIILSHLSRSQYREQIKNALRSGWSTRLETLSSIDLKTIDFDTLNKHMSREDILKTIAFQVAQMDALTTGVEIYTKARAADVYPELEQFLYRNPDSNIEVLQEKVRELTDSLLWEVGYYKNDKSTGRETTVCIPMPIDKNKRYDIDLLTEQLIEISN